VQDATTHWTATATTKGSAGKGRQAVSRLGGRWMWTQSHCRRAVRRPSPKLVRGAAAAYLHRHRAGASEALIQSSFYEALPPRLALSPAPRAASCSGTPHASRATPRGIEPSPRLFHAQKALHRPFCPPALLAHRLQCRDDSSCQFSRTAVAFVRLAIRANTCAPPCALPCCGFTFA
jgi:hypothetical protein